MDLARISTILLPGDFVDEDFPVTASFGQVNPAYWPQDHQGLDRGNKRDASGKVTKLILGAQVRTLWPGRVQLAGYEKFFGNRSWIVFNDSRHGLCRYLFAHMKELFLVEGALITTPVVAGLVGGTGTRRDGTPVPIHCHFQVEKWPSREILNPILPGHGGAK